MDRSAPKSHFLAEGALLLIAAILLFSHLGVDELNSADEAIHAQVAREMARDGHWLHPTYRGEPYLEKPPFKFWLTAATYLVAGESEFTARLWSAIFALGTVWAVASLGGLMFNRWAGIAAGFCLATTWNFLFNHCARTGELDSALLFFTTCAVMAFWKLRVSGEPRHLVVASACLALGVLTKGHIALMPLLWLPLAWWVPVGGGATGRIPPREWLKACAVFFIMVVPWFALQTIHYGDQFWSYMIRHNLVGYSMGRVEDADTTWHYYVEQIAWRDYPWPPLVILGVALLFCRKAMCGFVWWKGARAWVLAWIVVTSAVFIIAKTKLPWYYLPAWIPMALLAGLALERVARPLLAGAGPDEWSPRDSDRWIGLWLVLHIGLFFCLAGFLECAQDFFEAWEDGNCSMLADYGYYFFTDSNQRSALVAVFVLGIGIPVFAIVGFMTLCGARFSPFRRHQAFAMAVIGVAVMFAWRYVGTPAVTEEARDVVRDNLKKFAHMQKPLHVFMDDPFRERAPHYLISPAYYYYLAGSADLILEKGGELSKQEYPCIALRTQPSGPTAATHPAPVWTVIHPATDMIAMPRDKKQPLSR